MATPQKYKEALNRIVTQASKIPDRDSPLWASLPHPSQATLDDASACQVDFNTWLTNFLEPNTSFIALKAIARPTAKNVARFTAKGSKNKAGGPNANACHAHTDFVAARIEVSRPQDILPIVEVVKRAAGSTLVRTIYTSDHPTFVDDTGRITDIAYFMWVYDSNIGYIAELQIGLFSAFYLFSKNSEVRDNKSMDTVMKELFKLYDKMKHDVLATANPVVVVVVVVVVIKAKTQANAGKK
ncbi:hypothetical protein BU23DRAFT_10905 [Bimuria novae-zelandiae CBS 107.79]|uniref:Uncharacterized protein n=1 Tax=Bimuria novae-zelandiae CBS 107.79 TaxID=1447943 RepID=A0A6A5W0B7_9PLEO|nr:hypothetical protein BU23DRAFT_10905 [Bimuria novae-zelandiae CBS 107.79]